MKLRHLALAVPLFFAVAAVSGYLVRARSGDRHGKLRVDGTERTYSLHVPASYDNTKPLPLVLALHGRLGTGIGEERLAHLDRVSDTHNFLVVYPDGLDRSWADGRNATPSDQHHIDDVKFLSALIDQLASEYKIDPARIYATGMSNGGFMSGRLACDLANRLAAVAIVAASLSQNVAKACHPTPISAMIIQGTDDRLVPFAGGALGRDGSRGVALSHDAAILKFVEWNHCPDEPQRDHITDHSEDGTTIDVSTYAPCAQNSEVRSYVVNRGGHSWPGGTEYLPASIVGKTTRNLDASEVIWDFFSHHAR
jgi:polyhydroxybutyrate depolymerase